MLDIIPARGDIFWAKLEPVVGSEQGKSRPVLIISNNIMNEKASVVIIIPMTRAEEKVKAGPFNVSYQIPFVEVDDQGVRALARAGYHFQNNDGVLLCNQARTVSKNRLVGKVGRFINKKLIEQVESAIKDAYALEACDVCQIPLRPGGLACVRCGKQHRYRCIKCSTVSPVEYSYCPKCGGGIGSVGK
ncbi:type II toxin-antitoxin system PemK/MazF family toxin [Anaerospora hongkongensis]|uniref:type II toxin-antitoxin system PemK/MazF family toxin n=1 Tax=Anaerospora hongkongensis TaxID=244830 RepID=UPI002897186A|nr:type II toxin-antitoxin system PemK/MazF family toxin [Anaerospora hongkongensis]